jgi:PAS domain S-box-containing protein
VCDGRRQIETGQRSSFDGALVGASAASLPEANRKTEATALQQAPARDAHAQGLTTMTFEILCSSAPAGGSGLLRPVQSSVERSWPLEDDRDVNARNARLAAIVNASNDAIVSVDSDRIVQTWNPAATALFGFAEGEAIGRSIDELIAPSDELGGRHDKLDAFAAEKAVRVEAMRRGRDGDLVPVEITTTPIQDRNERTVAFAMTFRDISERRRAEEKAALLIGEVQHRSINLLTTVQAMAHFTLAGAQKDLLARFNHRLLALAANHSLLGAKAEQDIEIAELVCVQLGHFGGGSDRRMTFTGPPLALSASPAQTLGMALHELATNAAKYGALSNERGRVNLRWELISDGDDTLFVASWTERGGPQVVPPQSLGFGSSIIGDMVESELGGTVTMDFAPEGLTWRLECPATNLS